jgi:hypothetical protein
MSIRQKVLDVLGNAIGVRSRVAELNPKPEPKGDFYENLIAGIRNLSGDAAATEIETELALSPGYEKSRVASAELLQAARGKAGMSGSVATPKTSDEIIRNLHETLCLVGCKEDADKILRQSKSFGKMHENFASAIAKASASKAGKSSSSSAGERALAPARQRLEHETRIH